VDQREVDEMEQHQSGGSILHGFSRIVIEYEHQILMEKKEVL
jgi:hypothetical protein